MVTQLQDADGLAAQADALRLDIVELNDDDRAALPEWARIVSARGSRRHALWDIRRRKYPTNGLPRGIGSLPLRPEDVVADIGAHVGGFSVWCARRNVARVVAFEPSPIAWRVLLRNAELDPRIVARNAAVVRDGSVRTAALHVGTGPGTSNSLVLPPRNATLLAVPTIAYAEATAGATVIKIDVEGYEYELPILPVAPSVRTMLISFHLGPKAHRRTDAERIRAGLLADGFCPRVDVDFSARSIFMHEGVYERCGEAR